MNKITSVLCLAFICSVAYGDFESKMETKYEDLKVKLSQLKEQYNPYLQSIPEDLEIRNQQKIDSGWVSKYEVIHSSKSRKSKKVDSNIDIPNWHLNTYDDSAWEETVVPQWRYQSEGKLCHNSCILWYRTKFEAKLPKDGRRVFLNFEGVDWEAEVWLNDVQINIEGVLLVPAKNENKDQLKQIQIPIKKSN